MAAWIDDVREHHRRPAEHVVFEDHAGVERDVVLDLDVVADVTFGDTTTFWPMLQPRPMVASFIT
jgi:hypothetical protein